MAQSMKAVVVTEPGKTVEILDRPIPSDLAPKEVLFKVLVAAQNPTDWKHLYFGLADENSILGCDFVGKAIEVGKNVPKDVVGTIRHGFVRGGKSQSNGAYAEYIKQEWDITSEVPSNITAIQAASAPIPLFTACQALWLRLGLPRPDQDNSKVKGKWIVIWSGSTAVGQYAIQLAKLAGLRVATSASAKKHAFLKSLGAEVTVDYKDEDASEQLRKATGDAIEYGLDCISENGSVQKTQSAFGKNGGHLVCLLFKLGDPARQDVKTESTLAYTALGKDQSFGPAEFKSSKEDRQNMVEACKLATKLFAEKKIQPLEVTDLGDITTINKGLDMLKDGSATTKLVHTFATA